MACANCHAKISLSRGPRIARKHVVRRPLIVSLVVHVALAAIAATVWHTHVAAKRRATVLVVAPAEDLSSAEPTVPPPPLPRAPAVPEEDFAFPEPEAVSDVPSMEAPFTLPREPGLPPVIRLRCSLRPKAAPTAPPTARPVARPIRARPVAPPPRPARVRGPTRGPVLRASDARAPEYPRRARRLGHQGRVVLIVHVAADGTVARVEVETSSGFPSLDNAAVRAAERWRFQPALADGRRVAATDRRTIRFRLDVP